MQKSGKVWISDLKRRKKHDNFLIVSKRFVWVIVADYNDVIGYANYILLSI